MWLGHPHPHSPARAEGPFADATPHTPLPTSLANFVAPPPHMAFGPRPKTIHCVRAADVVYEGMNLPLDIVRTTGRAAKPAPTAEAIRELRGQDLELLSEEKGSRPPPLKRLRDRHHSAARLLASGKSEGEVAAITGYDISRISILKNDPAFVELLEFYRADVNREYLSLHEQLAGLSMDAAVILRERMEDEPDKLTVTQVLEIVRLGADRTGHGPSTKVEQNVNINLASRLDEARKRLASRTIDITPERSNDHNHQS